MKGLEYPLLATTLTEKETETIFSPIRQVALPKSGIVRAFPKAMTHAPLSHQGLGIPNLYTSQQVQHIMTVLKHGGTDTIRGNLITQSLEKWGFRSDSRCPRCKNPDESVIHVIVCPHPCTNDLWNEQISNLKQWLRYPKTNGNIIEAIILNLKKLRKSGGIYGHHYQDIRMRKAVQDQNNIGWDQFMLGRISTRWSTIQDRHYKRIQSRRTGERWAAHLIMKVWDVHLSMWNHRSESLHDTGNREVLGSKRMEKEISLELKKGCALLHPTEKYLFSITMTEVREWTAIRKQK